MNFNPDRIVVAEQLPPLENDRFLNKLSDKIENKLSAYRPNPEDFIDNTKDGYDQESIKKDLAYVEKLENIWEQEESQLDPEEKKHMERTKNIATITEGIIIDRLSGSWLNIDSASPDYQIIAHPTSKVDDYRVGADVALEIINNKTLEDSHLGLSIDITYSSNSDVIKSKLGRVFNEINEGRQPSIKYFENNAETYAGPVDIARCVLVLSRDTVEDLFKKEHNKDHEGLEKHPVQLSLIAQMEEQAKVFYKLSLNKGNERMAKIYGDVLDNITLLHRQKREDFKSIQTDEASLMEQYNGLKLLHNSLLEHLLPTS